MKKMLIGGFVLLITGGLGYQLTGLAMGAGFGILLGVVVSSSYVMAKQARAAPLSVGDKLSMALAAVLMLGLLVKSGQDLRLRLQEGEVIELTSPSLEELKGITPASLEASKLAEWLEEQVRSDAYAALSVAIADDNGLLFQHLAGEGVVAENEPKTRFPVASVTKMFTGTLLLRLAQEDRLELDTPVASWLPPGVRLPSVEGGNPITPILLATHRAGLPRNVRSDYQAEEGSYVSFQPEKLYDALSQVHLEFAPGTDRSYSNLGYGLLGHVMELASGMSYAELLQTRILDPAGMSDSTLLDYNDPQFRARLIPPRRRGKDSEVLEPPRLLGRMAPSGGLATTAPDLARFGSALLRPDSPLLDASHQALITADGSTLRAGPVGPKGADSALGRVRYWEGIGEVVYKDGGRDGVDAFLVLLPARGLAVAVIANRSVDEVQGSTHDIARKILGWLVSAGD